MTIEMDISSVVVDPARLTSTPHRRSRETVKDVIDRILCGDAPFLLRQIPSESIDAVITSPPYYLQRNYNSAALSVGGERNLEDYIQSLLDVFEEIVRVVKPTGNIIYNIGDKYLDASLTLVPFRFAIEATERFNVRLVNNITWVKTNPTPRQFKRRLVSSTEPFFHFARSPDYYYDRDSFLSDRDDCPARNTPSPRLGESYRPLIESSNLSRNNKALAHRSLDIAIKDVREGRIQSFRMKIKGIHAEAFGGQEGGRKSQMDRNGFTIIRIYGRRMKRDVIETPVESLPDVKHTAIFPKSIIREIIKLVCPPSGIVLDPYVGSGTTAVAASLENRRYVGLDIDPDYCEMARERIKNETG